MRTKGFSFLFKGYYTEGECKIPSCPQHTPKYKTKDERVNIQTVGWAGFGPVSRNPGCSLETQACFLFCWPVKVPKRVVYPEKLPVEPGPRPIVPPYPSCRQVGPPSTVSRVSRFTRVPESVKCNVGRAVCSSNAASWTKPSSSWLPASRRRGPCW